MEDVEIGTPAESTVVDEKEDEFRLLTRDDILKVNEDAPIWRRVRIGLLVGFWVLWAALLLALILIVVFKPKCPPRPPLKFWQSEVGYAIDPFSFKNGDGGLTGNLKGTPIIYFGSEVGFTCKAKEQVLIGLYPRGFKPSETIDRSWLLPMPWDRSGVEFTGGNETNSEFKSYMEQCDVKETVLMDLASGRGTSFLKFVSRLTMLKKNPSLMWGDIKVMEFPTRVVSDSLYVFTRHANRFPAFVIAINDPQTSDTEKLLGSVIDLSDICPKMKVRLLLSETSDLKEDEELDSHKIYIPVAKTPEIYVFECI
ncbi:unnamed protein product [Echinostoma caproni]|uniref:SLC3A2_N domain-containing protein n=1 Tax=Echinostoma caproni TaxID=27848 RepID=A0A183AD79_9TREM|nr:unnamed protein product [Echinostoma caproni]